jgi:uncharacterized protein YjbI with pentapeptide repeats
VDDSARLEELLWRGVDVWNRERPRTVDLREADLSGAQLQGVDLRRADLRLANLDGADLTGANLGGAVVRLRLMESSYLTDASLQGAVLVGANLRGVNLHGANLERADLRGADLGWTNLVQARVGGANFTGAHVYGSSAWDIDGVPAQQRDLVITPDGQAPVTVDDLELAQFIYLLLNNERLKNVLDTITSKAVLILGRFSERLPVLQAIRAALRAQDYVPILFDFEVPADRDETETVRTLAGMVRFVVVDLTAARSVPQELQAIVPDVMVPIRPLIATEDEAWAMFTNLLKYPWVVREPLRYRDLPDLIGRLRSDVIDVAENKLNELAQLRTGTTHPER